MQNEDLLQNTEPPKDLL